MSITPPNGTSPASEKKIFPEVPSDIKMKPKGISSKSSISSQPVEAAYMGNIKRLSPLQRFTLGQERDQNRLPTFPFKCPSIPLDKVEAFIKDRPKESLLVLGESVHQSLEAISEEYIPFYIDLAQVNNPQKVIEEKLYDYGFNFVEISEAQKNYKFLFVFYNCFHKANTVHPNLAYKNEIFRWWRGKLISFCDPFNLPGPPKSFYDCFVHLEPGKSYEHLFVHYDSLGLSDEEIQAALDEHLSPNVLQFVQQMKVMVPGFWELLRTRSLLHVLIQILPATFQEVTPKKLYDDWMRHWFAFREEKTGIKGLEKKCREFLTKLAKAMDAEKLTEVQCGLITPNKWDDVFYPEDEDGIGLFSEDGTDVYLRNSPLYKIDNRHGFLPSLQHYFATGNVQTVPSETVDVYYV